METFCLATLEAMASGSIVVAPDSGGAGELVLDSGLLGPFSPGDPSSLVESIERSLLLSGEDSGEAYRRYSMGYGWDRTFDSLFSVYRRVLEARDGAGYGSLEHPDGWWTP
jgi:glycosyltransferase involved in cell wall biosynthesis